MKLIAYYFILISGCCVNFLYAQNFQIYGDAFSIPTVNNVSCSNADTCFSLTSNTNWQQGAIWDLDTIDLSQAFDATFCMFLGGNDGGADGFAFVLRSTDAIVFGEPGGALGYGFDNGNPGITPSVAIEFDTYYNSDFFDINEDHTQLVLNGNVDSPPAVAAVSLLPSNANVEDNNFHNSRIVWDPALNKLSMYFDDVLRFNYSSDIINNVFNGNPKIFWGFTASTGGLSNLQQICFPKVLLDLPNFEICEQDSVLISYPLSDVQSYVWTSPSGAQIINWNEGMGFPLTETSFYASESGSYTLTVEFNNGFYSAVSVVQIVPFPEQVSFIMCENSVSTNLFSQFTNSVEINGTWSGPSILTGEYLGSFDPSINVPGTYTYSANNSTICLSDNTVTVNIYQALFNPTIDLNACLLGEYEMSLNPVMSNGQTDFMYAWSSSEPSLESNENSAQIIINANNTVQISIVSDDLFACQFDTILSLVFVPIPVFNLGLDTIICTGEILNLTANGNWDSYLWNTGEITQTITVNSTGTYTCEVTNAATCVFSDEIEVLVTDAPLITELTFDTISCAPFLVNFNAVCSLPNPSITWGFGDGATASNLFSVSHNYLNAGDYDLTLTVSASGSCLTTLFLEDAIHVLPAPMANFSYAILSNDGLELEVEFFNTSTNYTEILWDFNSLYNSSQQDTIIVFPITSYDEISISLEASTSYCSDIQQQKIEIPSQFFYYIPNSFTPDGNKFNNVFLPIFTDGVLSNSYHLKVYSRWGELLFESFDLDVGWDGTYGTRIVQDGVYPWTINFTEKSSLESRQINGHVSLLK